MAKKHRKKVKAKKRRVAPVKRKPRKKKVSGSARKKAVKRRKRGAGRKVVKQVERRSVERVMTGKKRTRNRRSRKRRVVMAGPPRRRRVSGSGGSSKMLIGLGLGALAIYLLTKKTTTTTTQYPANYQLPPISQTGNLTRNNQSQEIVNYALAAGLAADAITKIINSLNSSSDDEVKNVYDYVNTTGNIEYYA